MYKIKTFYDEKSFKIVYLTIDRWLSYVLLSRSKQFRLRPNNINFHFLVTRRNLLWCVKLGTELETQVTAFVTIG